MILLTSGIGFGFLLRNKEKTMKLINHASEATVYALLFFLGISVSQNKALVEKFFSLGLKAVILSFAGISGSVLISYIFFKIFFRENE
ncbi:LysO family transporter [candidate division WOR-3 bacterium]|nr:LysO family transporter [candidate division WOR-3 bacterium]